MASKRRSKLSIAVPASMVMDTPHLRERTARMGQVGRAAAIFRVDEVVVYPDLMTVGCRKAARLIRILLSYMETPPYLRRRLFSVDPSLRYAGILPPLRTPHHLKTSQSRTVLEGELRDGVVLKAEGGFSAVDVGLGVPLKVDVALAEGERVTVRIAQEGKGIKGVAVDPEEIEEYWGFKVTVSPTPLGSMLLSRGFDLVIATSRRGQPLMDAVESLRRRWSKADAVAVLFGAPKRGLQEILACENLKLEGVSHFTVNTVPDQGTETIRTEEAVYASLAALNLLISE